VNAASWLESLRTARLEMLAYLAGCFVLGLGALIMISFRTLAKEHAKQRETTEQIEESRSRLESIINSIDGIVWEWDPEKHSFIFVSQKAKEVLGYDAADVKADPYLWCQNIHPDDFKATDEQRLDEIRRCRNYSMDYRYIRSDGRTVWLRERGVCVPDAEGKTVCVRGILLDITTSQEAADKLEELNKRMVETSRLAGMAEVASGVLHNVGNVLNSVNVSSTVICDAVRESKAPTLEKLGELLESKQDQLAEFLTTDTRGKAVPQFISQLAHALTRERQFILKEMAGLIKNIAHIKQVVMMQQSFARTGGGTEPLDVVEMIEDSLSVNDASLLRHGIQVTRDFDSVPMALADRNKVLQILINLIRNAKHAMTVTNHNEHKLHIVVKQIDDKKLRITFTDNGMGMSADTLKQLFSYGFTTRRDGHGFGLHSGANAAREMGGNLTATSEGPGKGATFTLELPLIGTCAVALPTTSVPRSTTQPETSLPTMPALMDHTPMILGGITPVPRDTPVPAVTRTPSPEPALVS
jgi:PAS domain S-box-containing protein